MAVNVRRVETAARELLVAIGEDPSREGLLETPQRIAALYDEVLSGLDEDPVAVLSTQFEEDHQEMVILRDTPFYSMCEHHLLPFFGVVHIGYIPKGRIVGFSKLARAADILSRRPQVQERLTSQIADALMDAVQPDGVAAVTRAEFLTLVRGSTG